MRYEALLIRGFHEHGISVNSRRIANAVMAVVGFILSPLSWWNDLVINVPLAYLFSWPFAAIDEQLFLPGFIFGYWLTNLLGFIMLHLGSVGFLKKQRDKYDFKSGFMVSLIYTSVILAIVMLGWVESPTRYLSHSP